MTTNISTLFSRVIAVRGLDADWKTFWACMIRIGIAAAALAIVAYGYFAILSDVARRWHPMHVLRVLSASFLGLVAYRLVVLSQRTLSGRQDTFERMAAEAMTPAVHSIRKRATCS